MGESVAYWHFSVIQLVSQVEQHSKSKTVKSPRCGHSTKQFSPSYKIVIHLGRNKFLCHECICSNAEFAGRRARLSSQAMLLKM